ncbi:hypothetical protein C943_04145 [Mariniradius saccharolyticus AK6]|uniref:Uncharacterized protein n=1 Tax=Mariniradius saccharolyticus AK6 TaxID=1239962 RepID=M7Y9H8_9BACT|nr:hypothetical protein [Mariniradius saccharolyticus]EMS33826.1 hypothetical protein C943_04145 [Mariniradius saccharolyticus AK6]
MRKQLEINLPLYYYEYEPGKNAQVRLGGKFSIDFNQPLNDMWVSPTMGGQISGFKETVLAKGYHPFKSDTDYKDFLNLAYQIKNIRNRACHAERTSKTDLEKILDSWKAILSKGYLKTLAQLKNEYRGTDKERCSYNSV